MKGPKIAAAKEKNARVVLRTIYFAYSVTFSPHRLTKTNDLKPPEIWATFL
jgi:hypothetical protein